MSIAWGFDESGPTPGWMSGAKAHGEVKGASVGDTLKNLGGSRAVGDRPRRAAGELDNGVLMVLNSLKRQIRSRGTGTQGMIGLSRKFRVFDESGDGELQFPNFKKVRLNINTISLSLSS